MASVRNPDDIAALEQEGRGRIAPVLLDIGLDDSIERAAEIVRATAGRDGLLALVNSAAAGGRGSPMEYVSREVLESAFGVTTFGTFVLTRALIPMIRHAGGRIVNVGAGRLPLPLLGSGLLDGTPDHGALPRCHRGPDDRAVDSGSVAPGDLGVSGRNWRQAHKGA